ncbi:BPSL0761 family protein [Luteimonas sp. A478]
MQMTELALLAAMIIFAPLTLTVIVWFLVHRQNQRVLADRADRSLQAMLHAGSFLSALAEDASVPEVQRRRAQNLARDYPSGDQLRVFAESLLDDLRRGTRQPSQR